VARCLVKYRDFTVF